ncbi:hypothetical protein V0288_16665 [Pannus brasiliensis CCIBt3594]|uniref:Dynamin family protein n=1 Tax=Pannus brasiliensis CCIBt3594 TaxID=1427578 RepID=A0AAW9QW77_9CHRO
MNEEFKAFQKLLDSTDQLLAGDYSFLDSVEIRGSAEKVNKSLQPCLQQLKIYANQFQPFIKACFDELDRAEDVWNSKQRILDFPTLTIWEKSGEIAGLDIQIQTIGQECKRVAFEEARSLVSDMIKGIKQTHFIDVKNKKEKIDLGWGDKDNFNKTISGYIKAYSEDIEKVVNENFKKILLKYSYSPVSSGIVSDHMNVLDKDSYLKFKQDYDRIKTSFQQYVNNILGVNFQENKITGVIFVLATGDIANWKNKSGNITWKEIESFGTSFQKSVENKIERLFDHRMNFTKHSLQLLLKNYNDLLEKQSRYRQETPEQRLAEKAWIDRQRKGLQEIQARLDEILN